MPVRTLMLACKQKSPSGSKKPFAGLRSSARGNIWAKPQSPPVIAYVCSVSAQQRIIANNPAAMQLTRNNTHARVHRASQRTGSSMSFASWSTNSIGDVDLNHSCVLD